MGQSPCNPVRGLGQAPLLALTAGLIGNAKELGKERGIAMFAIGEEDQVVTMRHTLDHILVETANQPLVASSLLVGQNEFALWVDDFGFLRRLRFALREAMPFVCLQRLYLHVADILIMKRASVSPHHSMRTLHHTDVDLHQAHDALLATAFAQVFGYRHRGAPWAHFAHFAVPQRRPFAFTELATTAMATQITNPVFPVGLADRQVALTRLAVHIAFRLHTC